MQQKFWNMNWIVVSCCIFLCYLNRATWSVKRKCVPKRLLCTQIYILQYEGVYVQLFIQLHLRIWRESSSSLSVECTSQWMKREKAGASYTHTPIHTPSVGKTQWCIPAHISPAGDNCAISQRVPETLFTACCGGMGGGYELMSSKRKTTSSRMYTPQHRNKLARIHNEYSPISALSPLSR